MSKKLGVFQLLLQGFFRFYPANFCEMRGVAPLMDAGEERASAAKGATRVVVKSGFYMAFSPGNFAANLPNPVTVLLQTWATPVFTFPRADYSTFIAAQVYTFFLASMTKFYLVSFASKSHLFIYSVYIVEASFLLFTSFEIALEHPGSWETTTVAFSVDFGDLQKRKQLWRVHTVCGPFETICLLLICIDSSHVAALSSLVPFL